MSALSVALAHFRRRARVARALEQRAAALWMRVEAADLAGSWLSLLPQLSAALTAVQYAEAAAADAYVAAAMTARAMPAGTPALINASAFAGIASDGRNLDTLLFQPVITTKTALAAGYPAGRATTSGLAALQMIVGTQVADAGRVADQVAMVARNSGGYTRMVVGRTCDRCVVLAGRWYRWNASFDRHPKCDCVGIPAAEDTADNLTTDPGKYFRSLSAADQDKVFGKANAQAIRDGADISQVVNAHSKGSVYSAGGHTYTRESTTKRGVLPGERRLMPESIYKLAEGDRARAIELLRRYGYLF